MTNPMDSDAYYYTPRKSNIQFCQNCRTINPICHLKNFIQIILNKLNFQAEEIITENRLGSELE